MSNDDLFVYLDRHRDDRGLMATLRCALVPAKRHQAWPLLARRFGGLQSNEHRARTVQMIAGFYALHPPSSDLSQTAKNLGDLCRHLLGDDERVKLNLAEGVGPISRRFQHLLAADGEEIFDRVLRFVLRAKAEGVALDYRQLYKDLLQWQDHADWVRVRWARSFWVPDVQEPQAQEEAP